MLYVPSGFKRAKESVLFTAWVEVSAPALLDDQPYISEAH